MYRIQWRGLLLGWMISSNSSIYGNRMRGVMWLFSSTFHFAFPEKKGLVFFHFTSFLFLHICFLYLLINLPVSISPIYAFSIQLSDSHNWFLLNLNSSFSSDERFKKWLKSAMSYLYLRNTITFVSRLFRLSRIHERLQCEFHWSRRNY